MSAFEYTEESNGYRVVVTPEFIEEESNLERSYYFYSYKVKIVNIEGKVARLSRRLWVIRDGKGVQEVIEGPGVVGQHPTFKKGAEFEYESSCPLRTPTGNMRGKYFLEDEDGNEFAIQIPLFYLRHPTTFN